MTAATRTILIADDEPSMRKLYERELSREDCRLVIVASAMEAIAKIREGRPDVVILDVRMPGMDGIEALGRILEEHEDLPVIISTAYSCYQDSYLSWPAVAYVTKTSDLAELKAAVSRVLDPEAEPALQGG